MDVSDKASRAWATVREMLADRGIKNESAVGIGDKEIIELSREFTTFGITVNPTLSVVFHTSVATIKKNDLFNAADDASHVIVVFHTKAQGTTTRSIISEGISKKMTFEFFDMTSLQYNVTKHKYVPKHEKVPQEEIDGILKRYYLKSKFHLPIIIETDPIARYLGIKHGDLVKITRPSMNTGVTTIFRCCKA